MSANCTICGRYKSRYIGYTDACRAREDWEELDSFRDVQEILECFRLGFVRNARVEQPESIGAEFARAVRAIEAWPQWKRVLLHRGDEIAHTQETSSGAAADKQPQGTVSSKVPVSDGVPQNTMQTAAAPEVGMHQQATVDALMTAVAIALDVIRSNRIDKSELERFAPHREVIETFDFSLLQRGRGDAEIEERDLIVAWLRREAKKWVNDQASVIEQMAMAIADNRHRWDDGLSSTTTPGGET